MPVCLLLVYIYSIKSNRIRGYCALFTPKFTKFSKKGKELCPSLKLFVCCW